MGRPRIYSDYYCSLPIDGEHLVPTLNPPHGPEIIMEVNGIQLIISGLFRAWRNGLEACYYPAGHSVPGFLEIWKSGVFLLVMVMQA
jgi:hypothetical protein